jgi:hypothetical protein
MNVVRSRAVQEPPRPMASYATTSSAYGVEIGATHSAVDHAREFPRERNALLRRRMSLVVLLDVSRRG